MIIIPDKLRRPAEVERDELRKHLAEAQAEIENLKWRTTKTLSQTITELVAAKDKLTEQMWEARRLVLSEARSTHCEQTILAALAAERGE